MSQMSQVRRIRALVATVPKDLFNKKTFVAAGVVVFTGFLYREYRKNIVLYQRAHEEGHQLLKARGEEIDPKRW